MHNPTYSDWWAPTGWIRALGSEDHQNWRKLLEDETSPTSLDDLERICWADEADDYQVFVWKTPYHDLLIQTGNSSGDIFSEYFVRNTDSQAFLNEKLPPLIAIVASCRQENSLRMMSRALVSFIRHGHGIGTIDPDGLWTKDERVAEKGRLDRLNGKLP